MLCISCKFISLLIHIITTPSMSWIIGILYFGRGPGATLNNTLHLGSSPSAWVDELDIVWNWAETFSFWKVYSNKSISKTRYQRAKWFIFYLMTFIIAQVGPGQAELDCRLILSARWPTFQRVHCEFSIAVRDFQCSLQLSPRIFAACAVTSH